MLASLIIVFREVFEAGLIVGIVLAATEGIPRRAGWIAGGIGAGLAGAFMLALFAGALSGAFSGNGQEIFTASILILAVVMLGWHNMWMARHGREMAQHMKEVGQAVASGQKSLLAMAVIVAVAVLREGAEVVLFLYGIAVSTHEGLVALMTGGVIGIALGSLVSYILYRGLVAIPVKRLFSVTEWLIALLAAGMAGQAAAILAGADIIPSWGYQIWDTSWLLPEDSLVGRALHAMVGYSDRPVGIQLVAYLVVLAVLVAGARMINRMPSPSSRPTPARAAAQPNHF